MHAILKKLFFTFAAIGLFIPLAAGAQTPAAPTGGTSAAGSATGCSLPSTKWLADMGIKDGLIIPCGCSDSKQETPCTLNEVFQLIVNVTKVILGITGSAALLMFTYGGFMFIISSGNEERVKKAKDIISMAAIGLVIIFVSFLIINTLINVLTTGNTWGQGTIFGSDFGKSPSNPATGDRPGLDGENPSPQF
jgi:hypothetical protein